MEKVRREGLSWQALSEHFPEFRMKAFSEQLETRREQVDEQVLETLLSFSDYALFKEIMVEQRRRVEEEERTIRRRTAKAQKGQKKTLDNGNIFTAKGV